MENFYSNTQIFEYTLIFFTFVEILKMETINTKTYELNSQKPENNMVLSIIGTVVGLFSPCCIGIILGIIAVVFSSQVDSKYNSNDIEGAKSSAKNAKILAIIAIILGIIGLIMTIVQFALYGDTIFEEFRRSLEAEKSNSGSGF
jgi:cytochrome c biogenesis protein CcdA